MTSVRQVVAEGVGAIRGSSGTSVAWTRAGEGEMSRLGDKISGGEMISDPFNFNSNTEPKISVFTLIDTKNSSGIYWYVGVISQRPVCS